MEKDNEKQVIFFSDLLFSVLYRWKAMLIVALVLALTLGSFQLYADNHFGDSATAMEAQANLAHGQLRVNTLSANIKSQQNYLANSILMTMDPYQVSKITTDFYVYTDYQIIPDMQYQNPDQGPAVLRAYKMLLTTDEALDAFCQATGLERVYLSELIFSEVLTPSNVLSITVRCPNDEAAQKLTAAIITYLESKHDTVTTQIAAHTTSVISTEAASPVDSELAKQQDDAVARLTSLQTALTEADNNLTKLQDKVSETRALTPIEMSLIGAVAGILLVCVWAVLSHLATDKVYSGRVLTNRTGIRVLGAVSASKKNQALRKLEGRVTETAMDVVAMNISNYCDGKTSVLCLGQWGEEQKAALSSSLKELGIQACFEGSPLSSAAALKQLKEHEAVVLLGICGKSRYSYTEKEMQLIADQNKALLGCVLLGG